MFFIDRCKKHLLVACIEQYFFLSFKSDAPLTITLGAGLLEIVFKNALEHELHKAVIPLPNGRQIRYDSLLA